MIGSRVRRREDLALITGRGSFTADLETGSAVLAVIRSPHPHAAVHGTGLEGVRRLPGVLAAWDASTLPVLSLWLDDQPRPGVEHRPRPVLAGRRALHQGEPVAVVVAETEAQAADAAAACELELEPLEAAPELGGTVTIGFGDCARELAAAPVRIRRTFQCARITAAAIEPRAVLARPAGEGLLVHSSTQWAYGVRDAVAGCLGLEPGLVRVIAGDVGGAFGGKGFPYPEEVLVAAAARSLGRAVRWVASRSEETTVSAQAHGISFEVELGARSDGTLLALAARFRHDMGAYSAAVPGQAENLSGHLNSLYRWRALEAVVELWYSNRAPARFIRGGGRPLGNLAVERMVDFMADELGLDRLEIRRRNVLEDSELPHQPGYPGMVVEGGGFAGMLEAARMAADGPEGGVGVVAGIESSGIGRPEPIGLELLPGGGLRARVASTPHGQGHVTTLAQIVAERAGWPLDAVEVLAGDSGLLAGWSPQTAASRSAIEAGNAAAAAARELREALETAAAAALEAAPQDLEVGPEGAGVQGVPGSRRPWSELLPAGLGIEREFTPGRPRAWGANCHAARVLVDPETGRVDLVAHAVAHDAGREINPTLVEGQVHGGLAHGLGYALFEELAYDSSDVLHGATFLDYSIPGPPEIALEPRIVHADSRTSQNPEGFRGVGEAGTIPAPAAILSATEAALARLGITVQLTELPLTPDRLRAAIESATREA